MIVVIVVVQDSEKEKGRLILICECMKNLGLYCLSYDISYHQLKLFLSADTNNKPMHMGKLLQLVSMVLNCIAAPALHHIWVYLNIVFLLIGILPYQSTGETMNVDLETIPSNNSLVYYISIKINKTILIILNLKKFIYIMVTV